MATAFYVSVSKKQIADFTVEGGCALTASGSLAPGRFNFRSPRGFVKLVPTGLMLGENKAVIVFPNGNELTVSGPTNAKGFLAAELQIDELVLFGETYTRVETPTD